MNTQRGFTLIELAIVLVILTVLAGGLLMPFTARMETRRIAETRKTMEEAREAIMGYAMNHSIPSSCTCVYKADSTLNIQDDPLDPSDDPDSTCPVSLCPASATADTTLTLPVTRHYLPCPDLNSSDPEPNQDNDGVDGFTDLNNGVEDRLKTGDVGACATSSANLPWVTLGTATHDAWGNRLHYSLTNDMAGTYGDKSKGFSRASMGNNQICSTSAGGCSVGTVASNLPVVLVSYGPNGWGARNVNGTTQKVPSSADELENTDVDTHFVSHAPTQSESGSGEFDDLVEWISHDLLTSRVCPSGGCP